MRTLHSGAVFYGHMDTRIKILDRADLLTRIQQDRASGKSIVLANGCFDILHVGHLRYLQGAKKEGDLLVVAVNSDASVGKLKGAGRPILPEQARAELVAALRVVDYVLIFAEDDVADILRELKPDVHVKGTDYTPDTVPERAIAAEMGIRVAIAGDAKAHSTRGLLGSIRHRSHG